MENALKEGRLREDLYFRINTLMLHVPALRERPNDIPLLAEWFLQRFAAQHDRNISAFHPDALRALVDYAWPGNVRELQHVVERAVILTQGFNHRRGRSAGRYCRHPGANIGMRDEG